MNFDDTNFGTSFVHIIYGFFNSRADTAHGYDYVGCIDRTVIIEQTIICADFLIDFIRSLPYNREASKLER